MNIEFDNIGQEQRYYLAEITDLRTSAFLAECGLRWPAWALDESRNLWYCRDAHELVERFLYIHQMTMMWESCRPTCDDRSALDITIAYLQASCEVAVVEDNCQFRLRGSGTRAWCQISRDQAIENGRFWVSEGSRENIFIINSRRSG